MRLEGPGRIMGRITIGRLMLGIAALTPALVVARIDPFLGVMTAAYTAVLGWLAIRGWRAGGVVVRLALAFGMSAALIAGWFVVRDGLLVAGLRLTEPTLGRRHPWPLPVGPGGGYHVVRLASWEAWSLLRWWLLFGLLALRGAGLPPAPEGDGERARAEAARRLLGFAPWLALLEVGLLGMVWALHRGFAIIPEPSTTFGALDVRFLREPLLGLGFNLVCLLYWIVRAAPPVLVVGAAFYRLVLGWPGRRALLGALRLIPLAAAVSLAWTMAWYVLIGVGLVKW